MKNLNFKLIILSIACSIIIAPAYASGDLFSSGSKDTKVVKKSIVIPLPSDTANTRTKVDYNNLKSDVYADKNEPAEIVSESSKPGDSDSVFNADGSEKSWGQIGKSGLQTFLSFGRKSSKPAAPTMFAYKFGRAVFTHGTYSFSLKFYKLKNGEKKCDGNRKSHIKATVSDSYDSEITVRAVFENGSNQNMILCSPLLSRKDLRVVKVWKENIGSSVQEPIVAHDVDYRPIPTVEDDLAKL
jgi:hypothetical protein